MVSSVVVSSVVSMVLGPDTLPHPTKLIIITANIAATKLFLLLSLLGLFFVIIFCKFVKCFQKLLLFVNYRSMLGNGKPILAQTIL